MPGDFAITWLAHQKKGRSVWVAKQCEKAVQVASQACDPKETAFRQWPCP